MKKLINSAFFRSILTLASGSIIALLISFLASPIMTRLYDTSSIGLYTLSITAVSMFGSIICARYDMAIVTVKKEEDVYALIKLSVIITLVLSIIISCVYYIYNLYLSSMDSKSMIVLFIFTLVFLIVSGVNNVLFAYNNRHKEYKLITSVHVFRSLGKEAVMIIMGLLHIKSLGLLTAHLTGQILGANRQGKSLLKNFENLRKVNKNQVITVAKAYYKQPLYSVPSIFANNFSYSSINLFIASLFGLTTLGYYSLSYRILGLPLSIISNNVSRVFFEEASREFNKTNQYKRAFIKTSLFLFAISIPMVIIMILFSPKLFVLVYGNGWDEAGRYVSILAIMFGVRFIVTALSPGMVISGKQNIDFFINLTFLIVSLLVFAIVKKYSMDIYNYLYLICIFYSIVYSVFYIILFKNATNKQ
jgi:O-antigen/teichoic acid export membrane protein